MAETLANPAITPPSPQRYAQVSPSAPRRCDPCGKDLPPWPGNCRPRISCSDRCRRQRDFRERKIQRREQRIAEWAELAELTGPAPAAFIRKQMRALQDEIRALKGDAHPAA